MAREYCLAIEETSYCVPALTTGAPTTNRFAYIRLGDGNSFTPRMTPDIWRIQKGDGEAIPALAGSDSYAVRGTLRTVLYYSNAKRLLDWCITRVNAGRTTPWVTTDASGLMPASDLASLSLYHAIARNDGTFKRRRYAGCKVDSWRIEVSRSSPVAMLTLEIVASRAVANTFGIIGGESSDPTTTEFPNPAANAYPSDPVLFSHCSGAMTVGTSRTIFDSLTIQGDNKMAPVVGEAKCVQLVNFTGRENTLSARLLYKVTPDDRASLEANTIQASSVAFTNGTNTITLSLRARNMITGADDDLPIDGPYMQAISQLNLYDFSTGTDQGDIAFTFA